MVEESRSVEYTPTWWLRNKNQDALNEALQKLKEELMLLGFISLLLTVVQGLVGYMCIPHHVANYMLPCKMETGTSESNHRQYFHTTTNGRQLLSTDVGSDHCTRKGEVPMLSIEALHQLHIFIFVLALFHVVFCATIMVLGGERMQERKAWENSIQSKKLSGHTGTHNEHDHDFKRQEIGYWRKSAVVSWLMSFFKQFYGSITYNDYKALRSGFIKTHCPTNPTFDFHKYMLRTLEVNFKFKRLVGISFCWYLWLFVVFFLLLNIEGWHTYFWLSFLPLVLLLLVGAKLKHIITRLVQEAAERETGDQAQPLKPSDHHFWFGRPQLVFYLIHFILFQNSFEIAFFFGSGSTYGFRSCIMEEVGFILPRLIIG
ncbi:MLO-like protein 13 [Actinidia eriantha]|uniref:MLO-like protein 13 n=1 Tax=Actinidia eriantha TaxID=165200 RepID=UPI00258A7EA3|nr:MLO-like protein 13 [Actinidia eriantha]